MYNLINKTNTVYNNDCFAVFLLISLGSMSREEENQEGTGSEAQMKRREVPEDESRRFALT